MAATRGISCFLVHYDFRHSFPYPEFLINPRRLSRKPSHGSASFNGKPIPRS